MVERISKERVTVTACNVIGLSNSPIIYWEEWKPLLCSKIVRKLPTRCLGNRKACISKVVLVTI